MQWTGMMEFFKDLLDGEYCDEGGEL